MIGWTDKVSVSTILIESGYTHLLDRLGFRHGRRHVCSVEAESTSFLLWVSVHVAV